VLDGERLVVETMVELVATVGLVVVSVVVDDAADAVPGSSSPSADTTSTTSPKPTIAIAAAANHRLTGK
jgi:hypothetical protein